MKPAPFLYARPASLDEAIAGLAVHGDDAKVLAGGQSLVPMMNFRLARPAVLLDLARIPDLDGIAVGDGAVELGAMARQARVARSSIIGKHLALLATAIGHVGHHQIRSRGTIGGSLAHADPAAELPAVALLSGARLEATGPQGSRRIEADDFFEGPFTTALAADEILTSVRFPIGDVTAWAFEELTRRSGDFAIAGIAAARSDAGTRIVGFGLGWVPLRLRLAEAVVAAEGPSDKGVELAAEAARDEVDPMTDIHADAGYRRDAIAVLVRRALRSMR